MNRGSARALLKRRLQVGAAGSTWETTDLDELLRLATQWMQGKVLAIHPDAFKYVDRADIVGTTDPLDALYELPVGCITVHDLRILSDTTPGLYESLKEPITRAEALARDDSSELKWFPWDSRHFGLSPTPAANKANGIELEWGPTLTMATDADAIPVHDLLHMGVVIMAEKLAAGESGEDGGKIDPDLAPYVNAIPQYYQPQAAPGRFTVGISRGY